MLECAALLAWNCDTWQSRPTALCYRGNLGDFRWLCHGCILLMDYWQVIKRGLEASFRAIKQRYAATIYMHTVYCYICCCSLAFEAMFQTSIIWMKWLNNRLLLCLLRCTAVCGPADTVMLHVLLRCQLFIRNTVSLITKHNTTGSWSLLLTYLQLICRCLTWAVCYPVMHTNELTCTFNFSAQRFARQPTGVFSLWHWLGRSGGGEGGQAFCLC